MPRELAESTNLRYGRAEYMGEIMAVDKTVLELVQNLGCAVEAKHALSEVCTHKAQREPRTLRPRHCMKRPISYCLRTRMPATRSKHDRQEICKSM
jgi:hypothetical protein